jgi:hypothetical protein
VLVLPQKCGWTEVFEDFAPSARFFGQERLLDVSPDLVKQAQSVFAAADSPI